MLAAFVVNCLFAQPVGSALGNVGGRSAWHLMYLAQAVRALVFLFALVFIPESPRHVVGSGREDQARAVLTRLFGPDEAERKIGEIRASFSGDHRPRLSDVTAPGTLLDRKRVV